MKRYMNKAEALMCFKQLWNLNPVWERKNKVAKRQSWHHFTDSLCKSGNISLNQYEKWDNPF